MNVRTIPCLSDNYAYVLVQDGHAVVIDPSEEGPVTVALGDPALGGLVLDAIWLTHHHWDHVGGVEGLLAEHPVPVVGSRYDLDQDRIIGQTVAVDDGATLPFGGMTARIHTVPGHTLGAVAIEIAGNLFTGDTLFAGGCGRVFEGTLPMMRASLAKLRALDPALRVWCGHEYTIKNLEFAEAMSAEAGVPEPAVSARLAEARAQRARGETTVGHPLADELATNPFLRWDAPAVRAAAARMGADPDDPDAVFAALRNAKDRW
ncbi:MAG: hydroxyacylglutathione hydrolase [Pseudomonadota bacterium]|nr:hydroxyacylglutathione hydrolase [Pseudomonadota bacterium]